MKLQKIISLIILLALLMALAACKDSTQDKTWIAADLGGLESPKFTIISKTAVTNGTKIGFKDMEDSDARLFINTMVDGGYLLDPVTNYTDTRYTYSATDNNLHSRKM